MKTLKLVVKIDKDYINELFDEIITNSKGWSKFQIKTFKLIYIGRMKTLFNILRKRLSKYITTEGEGIFYAEQHGTNKVIDREDKLIEKFLFADEKELKKEKEYARFKSDRALSRIVSYLSKRKKTFASSLISKAIPSGSVMAFFNKLGIVITYEVIKK